ncbi:hypothetical protein EDB19DRAFT_1954420 [Suillus lakei]|nr:hypothetical protein EDB19DRAFT_1954420 [Suillus lakei]
MLGNLEGRYVRLEVISGKNLYVPSERIPAGIYISITVESRRRWKSATRSLSSEESVAWGDTVTLSSHASPALSLEIRASYEVDRMLGSGEVIGIIQMSWDEVLDHGDEAFELSFPPVHGICPSLTLKAAVVHPCGDQDGGLFDSIVDCEIARDTDAGHARFAEYRTSKTVSHLNDAVQHFQSVLDQCPVGHPDHASALTNLAYARLGGYIQNDLEDIDTTTSLFRKALALRPQDHPDHAFSLYNLIRALNWRYSKEPTAVYIHESAQLCCKLLPLCPEGTYLRSIGVDILLELCPLGHQRRPRALDKLSWVLFERFTQRGSIDDIDESIRLRREAVSLCPEGHADRDDYLNNLACSLQSRFNHQGQYRDLNEVISTHEEVLRLHPVGHETRDISLDHLGFALLTCFNHRGVIDDINRAISLHREELTLHLSGHPRRDTTLANLALALDTRYEKLHVDEDLNEAIDLYRESLRLKRH